MTAVPERSEKIRESPGPATRGTKATGMSVHPRFDLGGSNPGTGFRHLLMPEPRDRPLVGVVASSRFLASDCRSLRYGKLQRRLLSSKRSFSYRVKAVGMLAQVLLPAERIPEFQ